MTALGENSDGLSIAFLEPPGSRAQIHEPIGLTSVAKYVRANRPNVQCHQLSGSLNGDVLDTVDFSAFDIVAVSAKLGSFGHLKELYGRMFQSGDQNGLLVVGGLLATYAHAELCEHMPLSIFVLGDGEQPMCDIITAVSEHGVGDRLRTELADHKNIIVGGVMSPVEKIPATLPPSRAVGADRSVTKKYVEAGAQIQIEGSRGCSWNRCTFCSIPRTNIAGWKPFGDDLIIQQIVQLSNAGAMFPHFTDSDFFGNDIGRATRLADKIIHLKSTSVIHPSMKFYFNLLPSGIIGGFGVKRKECVVALKRWKLAGLKEVFVGVESGAKEQIQRYKKAATNLKNTLAIRTLSEIGIECDIGFIMFDPPMNLDELLENIEYTLTPEFRDHPSRMTQAMRLQAGTEYAQNYIAGDQIPIDISSLSYPYSFENSQVGKIHKEFSQWEQVGLPLCHAVQSLIRSSNASEAERIELRNYLGQLRRLDKEYLLSQVLVARSKPEENSRFDSKRDFASERKGLFSARPEIVDRYLSSLEKINARLVPALP